MIGEVRKEMHIDRLRDGRLPGKHITSLLPPLYMDTSTIYRMMYVQCDKNRMYSNYSSTASVMDWVHIY